MRTDEGLAQFAILMPHFNQSGELDEAIASCAQARLANRAHLVVVDDGSSADHDISDLMNRWSESGAFSRVSFVRNETNSGVAIALNNGLEAIDEPYFFRLDSDDRALPDRFEVQLQYLERGFDLVFSEARIMYEGEIIARTFSPPSRTIEKLMPVRCLLMHPTLAASTQFFRSRGGYPEGTKTEDWEFWKLYLGEAEFLVIDAALTDLGLNLNSVSNAKFERSPGFQKTFKLKTALRYSDRAGAMKAAKDAGLIYQLGVYIFPNPYKLRRWLQLVTLSLKGALGRAGS